MKAPDWSDRAECRDMETALFYPGNHGIGTGIRAALSPAQLIALRRRRYRKSRPHYQEN